MHRDSKRTFVSMAALTNNNLINAAYAGDVALVRHLLLNGVNVDCADDIGVTPLHHASTMGHLPVVQLLLANNASVTLMDRLLGATPLHAASVTSCSLAVVKCLLANGANVDHEDLDGNTALQYAARHGCLSVVKILLENGANVNHENSQKQTALHHASENCEISVVKLLLANNADPNHADISGFTALHCATRSGCVRAIKLLVKNGAKVDQKTGDGETAIVQVSKFREWPAVLFFIRHELGFDQWHRDTHLFKYTPQSLQHQCRALAIIWSAQSVRESPFHVLHALSLELLHLLLLQLQQEEMRFSLN